MVDIKDFIKVANEKKEIRHSIEIINNQKFHIFCYMIATPELFKNDIEKECRGIVFDDNGICVCRPFNKFFNIGEREETLPQNVDWSSITHVSKKIDGSLVTPVLVDGKVYWKTKKSFFSPMAIELQKAWDNNEEWIRKHEGDINAFWLVNETPLFEFISNDNRIVIDYNTDHELILIGSRHNDSGKYWLNEDNCDNQYLKYFKNGEYNKFIQIIKNTIEIEGYVLYSENNVYKLKTQWYMDRHHLLSNISYKNIIELIVDEKIDDVVAELRIKNLNKSISIMEALQKEFAEEFFLLSTTIEDMYDYTISSLYVDKKCERKDFAMFLEKFNGKKGAKGALFLRYDNKYDLLHKYLSNLVADKLFDKYRGKVIFMGEEQ